MNTNNPGGYELPEDREDLDSGDTQRAPNAGLNSDDYQDGNGDGEYYEYGDDAEYEEEMVTSSMRTEVETDENTQGWVRASQKQMGSMANSIQTSIAESDENDGDSEDQETRRLIKQLKERKRQKKAELTNVNPQKVVEIFENAAKDIKTWTQASLDKLDQFFDNDTFFSRLREQTDASAVHDCYKVLKLEHFEAHKTVLRYGSASADAFFVLSGAVEVQTPVCKEVTVSSNRELIQFYASHFDHIIWEKVTDAEEIRALAAQFREDPDMIEFSEDFQGSQPGNLSHQPSQFMMQTPNQGSQENLEKSIVRDSSQHMDFTLQPSMNEDASKLFDGPYIDGSDVKSQSMVEGDAQIRAHHITHKETTFSNQQPPQTHTETVWLFDTDTTLFPGHCFGQSNLTVAKPSMCTYYCLEATVLASISKDLYQRIVEKAVKKDLSTRVSFLKSFRIFHTMGQNQMEKLMASVKLQNIDRGKVLFESGKRPDGVYLIQEGQFEVTKPALLQQRLVDSIKDERVDPMAKFSFKKKNAVVGDKSKKSVKLAILGPGELFGLEECVQNPRSNTDVRKAKVTCMQNGSKVLFINHQAFYERVMYDSGVEREVRLEVAMKEFFYNSRILQHQQTIDNGKLIGMKQIEQAAIKAEEDYRDMLAATEADPNGPASPRRHVKGMPALAPIDSFFKDAFKADVVNKLLCNINERNAQEMAKGDPETTKIIHNNIQLVESYFNSNVKSLYKQQKHAPAAAAHGISTQLTTENSINSYQGTANAVREQQWTSTLSNSQNVMLEDSLMMDSAMQQQMMQNMSDASLNGDIRVIHSTVNRERQPPIHQRQPVDQYIEDQFLPPIHQSIPPMPPGKQRQGKASLTPQIGGPVRALHHPVETIGLSITHINTDNAGVDNSPRSLARKFGATRKASGSNDQFGSSGDAFKKTGAGASQFKGQGQTNKDIEPLLKQQTIEGIPDDSTVVREDEGTISGLNKTGQAAGTLQIKVEKAHISAKDQQYLGAATIGSGASISALAKQKQPTSVAPVDNLNKTQQQPPKKSGDLITTAEGPSSGTPKPLKEATVENITGSSKGLILNIAEGNTNSGGVIISRDPALTKSTDSLKEKMKIEKIASLNTDSKAHIKRAEEAAATAEQAEIASPGSIPEVSETTGDQKSILGDPRYSHSKRKMSKKRREDFYTEEIAEEQKSEGRQFETLNKSPAFGEEAKTPDAEEEVGEGKDAGQANGSKGNPFVMVTKVSSRRFSNSGEKETVHIKKQLEANLINLQGQDLDLPYEPQQRDSGLRGNKKMATHQGKPNSLDKSKQFKGLTVSNSLNRDSGSQIQDAINAQKKETSFLPEIPGTRSRQENISGETPRGGGFKESGFGHLGASTAGEYSSVEHERQPMGTNMFSTKQTTDNNILVGAAGPTVFTSPGQLSPLNTQSREETALYLGQKSRDGESQSRERTQSGPNAQNFVPSQMNPRLLNLKKMKTRNQFVKDAQTHGGFIRKSSAGSVDTKRDLGSSTQRNPNSLAKRDRFSTIQQIRDTSNDDPRMNAARVTSSSVQNSFMGGTQYAPPMDGRYTKQTSLLMKAQQGRNLPSSLNMLSQTTNKVEISKIGRNSGMSSPKDHAKEKIENGGFDLSPNAAAAASELIQRYILQPGVPLTTEDFMQMQVKYGLGPQESYTLLLQQISFQKALLATPTAATVVKVSHQSYTSHVQQKREEIIAFRNDLFKKFTKLKKPSARASEKKSKVKKQKPKIIV